LAVSLEGCDLWLWLDAGRVIKGHRLHSWHRNRPSPLLKECSDIFWKMETRIISGAASSYLMEASLRIDDSPEIPKNAGCLG